MASQRRTDHANSIIERAESIIRPAIIGLSNQALRLHNQGYFHDRDKVMDLKNAVEITANKFYEDIRDVYGL